MFWGLPIFFGSTRHALYSIPAFKLLAIFKRAKLDFFFGIFRATKGSLGVFPGAC